MKEMTKVRARYTYRVPAHCVVRAEVDDLVRCGAVNVKTTRDGERWKVEWEWSGPDNGRGRIVVRERNGRTEATQVKIVAKEIQDDIDRMVPRRQYGQIASRVYNEKANAIFERDQANEARWAKMSGQGQAVE